MSKPVGQNTLCVHSAHTPEPATGALSQPIYLTTTFERDADGGYPPRLSLQAAKARPTALARSVASRPSRVASGRPRLPRGSRLAWRAGAA